MAIEQFDRGDTVSIRARIQTGKSSWGTDADADPDNGAKITITDPSDTVLVSEASMTKAVTGKYYYPYQTTTSLQAGRYKARVTADGLTYDNRDYIEFDLVN